MMKGIKGFLKTPMGDYAFHFFFMGVFLTGVMNLYDKYLDRPLEVSAFLLRFITFGLLGIVIRRIEKSANEKKAKAKADNSNK